MERAATIASSFKVEQDNDAQTRFETVSIKSNDLPLSRVNTLGSGEDSLKLIELMAYCTKLSELIQALVDKQKVIITEESIRRDIHFDDAEGTDCLPNDTIFEELARMGYEKPSQSAKTTAWNEFSSTMASAIICLANNQKFNFSKQVEGMSKHKETFVISSHTKKVFANIRRQSDQFFGRVTPLFDTMMVQASEEKSRRRQRNETEDLQDEAKHEENILTPSNDPLPSGEDSFQLNELMVLCTSLQKQVLDLEQAKTAQAKENVTLKKRVKKLERRRRSRLTRLRRSRKVGVSRRVESSKDVEASLGDQKDASKQGRSIKDIDVDAEDEMSLAQTLIEIKASKIKAVTTASTTVTTAATTRPKAKGIVMQEPSKRDLDSQLQAELIEEERIKRQKKEEANIALIESWEIHKL
ncbi:hypothetical protein Tco_1349507 [Tanacetum coccineum]